jgi:hypothetical protein
MRRVVIESFENEERVELVEIDDAGAITLHNHLVETEPVEDKSGARWRTWKVGKVSATLEGSTVRVVFNPGGGIVLREAAMGKEIEITAHGDTVRKFQNMLTGKVREVAFEEDAALAEPRCKNCKHFQPVRDIGVHGVCGLTRMSPFGGFVAASLAHAVGASGAFLEVSESFGCVQFEAKPVESVQTSA